MAKDELRNLPLTQVRPNDVALRSVNKKDEKFVGLVDSVRSKGILNPVLCREMKDPSTNTKYWGLIDGLHRYTAAVEAGLETIPAHIVTADEADVLEMQIIGNIHRVETKPTEYSAQLHRLLALNPTMTAAELAAKLGKSTTWIGERLGLLKLNENIKDLVDTSKINITNAYQLAKLPVEEQTNFVDRAMTMTPGQFVPTVQKRVKELRDAKRQGRQAEGEKEFIPSAFLQTIATIKDELATLNITKGAINQFGLKTALEGAQFMLQWVLHIDPTNVELQRQKEEERKRQLAETRAQKKREKEELEQREAITVAAEIGEDDDDEDEE